MDTSKGVNVREYGAVYVFFLCNSDNISTEYFTSQLDYLSGGGTGCPVAGVTQRVHMVGGASGRRMLDDVHVGDGEDALLGAVWDLPLVPVRIHLPQHHHSLTLGGGERERDSHIHTNTLKNAAAKTHTQTLQLF